MSTRRKRSAPAATRPANGTTKRKVLIGDEHKPLDPHRSVKARRTLIAVAIPAPAPAKTTQPTEDPILLKHTFSQLSRDVEKDIEELSEAVFGSLASMPSKVRFGPELSPAETAVLEASAKAGAEKKGEEKQ